ncbi:MAG: FAD-binding domain-containing protein [Crocinitomicaceae bacterium]
MLFQTDFSDILAQVSSIDPLDYGKTRNYGNGSVTYLSPYISRGVISVKDVYDSCLLRGYEPIEIESFIKELVWREYWQQIWISRGDGIDEDLKYTQVPILHLQMPQALMEGKTGIDAIDKAILDFYQTGYLHNHMRMYIASVVTNIARAHWKTPAKWMYYHLLDADWASNSLSWQWVCGANSKKKYFANQENINHYFQTEQQGTFLDVAYEDFPLTEIPESLMTIADLELTTELPESDEIKLDANLGTCLYTFYNLDPLWRANEPLNRILLLEPSHFQKYPISTRTVDFILQLAQNIEGIQVFVGEFSEIESKLNRSNIYYKEHPTNEHFRGTCDARTWLTNVKGEYPSFFAFWKKVKKDLIAK